MLRHRVHILAALLTVAVAGCASHDHANSGPQLQKIEYHRTGGLVGTDDLATIKPDGTFSTSGKMLGHRTGQLREDQVAELIRVFDGWAQLKRNYPPDPHASDAMTVELRYGGRTVTASDASPELPEQFRDPAIGLLEVALVDAIHSGGECEQFALPRDHFVVQEILGAPAPRLRVPAEGRLQDAPISIDVPRQLGPERRFIRRQVSAITIHRVGDPLAQHCQIRAPLADSRQIAIEQVIADIAGRFRKREADAVEQVIARLVLGAQPIALRLNGRDCL